MGKSKSIVLSDEAWNLVSEKVKEVNRDFDGGKVKPRDVVNEMIITARIDIKILQGKHTNLKKLLRAIANRKDIEVDSVLKLIAEAKGKIPKKKTGTEEEV